MRKNSNLLSEQAERIARNISIVSPVACNTLRIDACDDGEGFYHKGFCKYCREYRQGALCKADCRKMMSFSCIQSEQWGGKYESLCPLSLAFISTMIYNHQERIGLYMGPFLMVGLEDILEDVLKFFPEDKHEFIETELSRCSYINPGEVTAYSDILFMLASYGNQRNSMDAMIMEQVNTNSLLQFDLVQELQGTSEPVYSIDVEKRLLSHLEQQDIRAMQVDVNEIVSRIIISTGSSLTAVLERLHELVVLLSRRVIDSGANMDIVFNLSDHMTETLKGKKSIQELYPWITEFVITYSGLMSGLDDKERSGMVNDIITYLRVNYMRKVSLKVVADYLGLSESYISRVFNKEVGCSITTYLNGIRVENAKILLLEKNLSLAEIAYICGFDDQTYFSKIFKKHTGISPGKYRDKRGRYYISPDE